MTQTIIEISGVIVAILAVLAAAYKLVAPLLAAKTKNQEWQTASDKINGFVLAAEQIQGALKLDGVGKKAYVLDLAEKSGLKITADELDALIESAVKVLDF
ncbi:MAG: hypothetical protein LBN02_01815 [Oscillospiraceae bacterium]|jgi:hypothetical protein|nr:hypothetical protein [Oscillospiraceae bacterium]